jgi:hypothetical protein
LKRGSELWLGYTLTLYAQLSGDIVQRRRAAYNAIAGGVPIDEVIAMHMISLPIMAQSFLRARGMTPDRTTSRLAHYTVLGILA